MKFSVREEIVIKYKVSIIYNVSGEKAYYMRKIFLWDKVKEAFFCVFSFYI